VYSSLFDIEFLTPDVNVPFNVNVSLIFAMSAPNPNDGSGVTEDNKGQLCLAYAVGNNWECTHGGLIAVYSDDTKTVIAALQGKTNHFSRWAIIQVDDSYQAPPSDYSTSQNGRTGSTVVYVVVGILLGVAGIATLAAINIVIIRKRRAARMKTKEDIEMVGQFGRPVDSDGENIPPPPRDTGSDIETETDDLPPV